MALIVGLVFLGVFAVIALPLIASSGPSKQAKDVQTRLESALATETPEVRDLVVDLRKDEQMSSIPWLNRRLLQFEVAPYLRKILDQANLSWSAGRLLAMCGVCFIVPVVVVHYRLGTVLPSLLAGVTLVCRPMVWFSSSAVSDSASLRRGCRKHST